MNTAKSKLLFACLLLGVSAAVIALPYLLKPSPVVMPKPSGEEPAVVAERDMAGDSQICRKLAVFAGRRPPSDILDEISANDAGPLLDAYHTQNLHLRRSMAWGLGYAGGDEAAAALIRGLTDDFASKKLTADEESALLEHLLALGFAAEKSDNAFVFLRQAAEEEFWQRARTWTSSRGKAGAHLPVYFALQGLGLSGRPEAKVFLESCHQRDAAWCYRYASSVAQGLFYLALRAQNGSAAFRRNFTALASWEKWEEWRRGAGREWAEWADACRRGRKDG